MKLTIGRSVIYKVRDDDAPEIRHNSAKELPAIVVATFSVSATICANLRILTDGPDSPVWKPSVVEGTEAGMWHWPERV
jgi:hypothetical protein